MSIDPTAPVVVVSADSHVGPRLREDLRSHCPSRHVDDFDAFATACDRKETPDLLNSIELSGHANGGPGHYDSAVRLEHMDSDGVAAEVIYHGSMNGEPIPWASGSFRRTGENRDRVAVGYDIYNSWLCDFCGADPKRLLGLVYIPAWDITRSVAVVERAAAAGIRGVNFPVCNRPGVLSYNDPAWDPFWAACVDNGVTLHTHANGAPIFDYGDNPGSLDITLFEAGGWMSRRAPWHLIYGQVFDRFPDLVLVLTEVEELWYRSTQWSLDAAYRRFGQVPLKKGLPSAYFESNVYYGSSFMSAEQAEDAWRNGYASNVIWGRDYPHMEGCFQAGVDTDEPFCRLALRNFLSRVPPEEALMLAGANGVRAMALDGTYLEDVAARIGAPDVEQLRTPLGTYPEVPPLSMAFSGHAGPHKPEHDLEHFTRVSSTKLDEFASRTFKSYGPRASSHRDDGQGE